jgi:hypothetical protein
MLRTFRLLGFLPLVAAACVMPCPRLPVTFATPACPVDKITFTQDNGCLNDGNVEFCVPARDPAALAAVRRIAPDVTCMQAAARARCDTTAEVLCFFPTDCSDHFSPLPDSRWQTVCDLAALPFVRQIIPTWYE